MNEYTLEVTTAPVINGDWSVLRNVLDMVPGSILIEDPEEPMLVVPVTAANPMKAAKFMDGLSTLMGFSLVSGNITPTPTAEELGIELDDESPTHKTEVEKALERYVENDTSFSGRLTSEGRLVSA
ncbi:hypothetical protein ACFFIO_09535 [Citricoccus parietis]|uniref:Uncharacterized protein n=1 Tax=Citricoccus parietis TaxID=592307 RepID=A0ABV6F5F2_9MICC